MSSAKRIIGRAGLRMLGGIGAFRWVRDSRWRRQRLLILCYHGVSLDDEHLWRPALYVESARLEQRLEILKQGNYNVLPLSEGLQRLKAGTLPPRSVVLTFDDGGYDFYARAYPILKRYGFPVTVYQTTYYVDLQLPLFNLICSYMLWKRRGSVLETGRELGIKCPLDLRTEASREQVFREVQEIVDQGDLTGLQKNQKADELAKLLEIDYRQLLAERMLQLMNAGEISELVREGVDFQMHTHRHRAPLEEAQFRAEIQENRRRLQEITGRSPEHFCYPSGIVHAQFPAWLSREKIVSATTCQAALATSQTNPLLLPRFVDTTGRTEVEFESWLAGVSGLFTHTPV